MSALSGLQQDVFTGTKDHRLVRKLGQGGMGAVFEVDDRVHGRRCALKLMMGADSESMMRFKREFRTIADLRHPNLVKLYDLHTDERQRFFYTMELIQGADMARVLLDKDTHHDTTRRTLHTRAAEVFKQQRTMRLDTDAIVQQYGDAPAQRAIAPACDLMALQLVLAQLLDALEFLHGHGIVHRDLKPDNILIDETGRVCVMDFGVVKNLDNLQKTGREGAVLGTLAYMAPEQAKGKQDVGPAADLYAVGCILYQMLTGQVPFEGGVFEVMMAHQLKAPPSPSALVMGVPEPLARMCTALMDKDPAARPSIEELRRTLSLKALASTHQVRELKVGDLFVGRHSEMARLESAMSRALRQDLQMVVIHAESGGGKTMLTNAVIERARDERGFEVLRGRCYEREAMPFRAFDQIMDNVALVLGRWSAPAIEALEEELTTASCVFPVLRYVRQQQQRPRNAHPPPSIPESLRHLGHDELRQVVFEHVARIFEALQRQKPLLVVIDDLQWTDAESVALLEVLLNRCRRGRIMFLGGCRPEGIAPEHALRRLVDRSAEAIDLLALEPLSFQETARLMVGVMGEGVSTDSVLPLVEQIGGNPFFAVQLALTLSRRAEGLGAYSAGALPPLGELVSERFGELSAAARAVLELAATAGGACQKETLRIAAQLPEADFSAALDELIHEKMLRPTIAHFEQGAVEDHSYDLYHDKYRELAYGWLEPERRQALHLALVRTLEAQEPRDVEALLRHWGALGEQDRVADYALKAAEEAAAKLAFGRAARLYRRVLEGRTASDGAERAVLIGGWERAGELCELQGDLHGALDAWGRAVGLIEHGEKSKEAALSVDRLRRLQAGALFRTRQLEQSQRLYGALLAPRGLRLRRGYWRALLTLGWLQTLMLLWAAVPERWMRRPSSLWQRERMALMHDITDSVGWMWLSVGLEYNMRSTLLARRLTDPADRLHAQVTRAVVVGFSGNALDGVLRRSHGMLDRADETARRHQIPLGLEFTGRWRAALFMQHDPLKAYDAAAASVMGHRRQGAMARNDAIWALGWQLLACETLCRHDEALEICKKMETYQTAWAEAFAFAPRLRILARLGRFERSDELHRRWTQALPSELTAEHFWVTLSMGMVDVARGRFESVLEEMNRLYEPIRGAGTFLLNFNLSYWMMPYLDAAVGLARAGKLSAARSRRIERAASRVQRLGIVSHRSMGARAIALMSHHRGDARRARRHLGQALALSEAVQAPYHRWCCVRAALEMGVETERFEAEAKALAEAHGFVLPRDEPAAPQ